MVLEGLADDCGLENAGDAEQRSGRRVLTAARQPRVQLVLQLGVPVLQLQLLLADAQLLVALPANTEANGWELLQKTHSIR